MKLTMVVACIMAKKNMHMVSKSSSVVNFFLVIDNLSSSSRTLS